MPNRGNILRGNLEDVTKYIVRNVPHSMSCDFFYHLFCITAAVFLVHFLFPCLFSPSNTNYICELFINTQYIIVTLFFFTFKNKKSNLHSVPGIFSGQKRKKIEIIDFFTLFLNNFYERKKKSGGFGRRFLYFISEIFFLKIR